MSAAPPPLVSVLMITYNHEEFIGDSLLSILAQQTNFRLEVVVGEDCSTDRTRSILRDYESRYPSIIHPVFHEKNVGMMANSLACLLQCKGKYIACLEGDDYWTDPLKLQKQVDFLEANPDYAICAHRVNILENETLRPAPDSKVKSDETLTIAMLAIGNTLHTPSVVFRNGLIDPIPIWFVEAPLGDYVLHMLNARKGKIRVLADTMAVYRRHAGGIWSPITEKVMHEKLMQVISLLLTEDFDAQVTMQLKVQWRSNASAYLKILLATNQSLFKSKLTELTGQDEELGRKWLQQILPEYIFWIKNSRSYRFINHLTGFINKIRHLFT